MSAPFAYAVLVGLTFGFGGSIDETKLKMSECPEPVQKTFKAEVGTAKVETVTREKDEDGETTYWVELVQSGKPYSIGVLADGTLSEITLGIDSDLVPFDKLPSPVQMTFKTEGYAQKIESAGKELKYGIAVFEAVVDHKGKKYTIVVAEEGTLVEKVLIIEDEEVEFAKCPAPVQATLTKHAAGVAIPEVTRYAGITKPTYEAEIEINGRIYLIEVAEAGYLISMSLEADPEE